MEVAVWGLLIGESGGSSDLLQRYRAHNPKSQFIIAVNNIIPVFRRYQFADGESGDPKFPIITNEKWSNSEFLFVTLV